MSHVRVWYLLSHVQLCDPMTVALYPWNSPGRNIGVVAISFSRGFPNPGIEPRSSSLQADSLPAELQGKPNYSICGCNFHVSVGGGEPRIFSVHYPVSWFNERIFTPKRRHENTSFFFMSLYLVLCLELLNQFSYLKEDEANTEKD